MSGTGFAGEGARGRRGEWERLRSPRAYGQQTAGTHAMGPGHPRIVLALPDSSGMFVTVLSDPG